MPPGLLILFAPADHPHRDPACATLAWMAREEGLLFECYFDGQAGGIHFGGGHPGHMRAADLRGGTFTGGHHLEQLQMLLQGFHCQAACLGPSLLDGELERAGVRFRSRAKDVVTFYREVFEGSRAAWPEDLLVVGDGGRPQGISLTAYAFPEVINRRLLAIADGDPESLAKLAPGMRCHAIWAPEPPTGAGLIEAPEERSVAIQTAWMAGRWSAGCRGFLLGDPELVGRWTPAAARAGWLPLFGFPQQEVIELMGPAIAEHEVVCGRQQDDRDFLSLSRLGVAFQLVDPGRPPFPVIRELAAAPRSVQIAQEASDADLSRWAEEGRVLSTLLFWTGMIRELENLYALADVLNLTGLAAGLVLTTGSFEHMPGPPLSLLDVDRELGGLSPRVEALLASGGSGAFLESMTPPERFAACLRASVHRLSERLGGRDRVPRGWWGTMDAPLVELRRPPRLSWEPDPPHLKIRYRSRPSGPPPAAEEESSAPPAGRDLRALVRESPVGRYFEPLRPFDGFHPGPAGRSVLETVRDCGFEYAFTKSAFGLPPRVVPGIDGLTVLNYTAGRWDGWTPFETINTLTDLERAERRLLRPGRPGWLVGTLDTCLWAFTGPLWERGARLQEICAWTAGGGGSGRLINVTPRTVARYARLLEERGMVKMAPSE